MDNIIIYNGYPLSVIVAISFHCLLLALLLYMQSSRTTDTLELVQPTIIKALFIDENPQVANQQNAERQRLERIEQQRIEQQRRDREQEQRRLEQETAQREAEAARAREQERSALIERQRLEEQRLEQQRAEQERAEQERAEQQRTEQLAAEQQRQRELAEAERVRQQDQALQQEAARAEGARTEYELVQSATGLIQQVVQENWSRPPSARNGMRAILQIRMLPTGELVDATITQSSGDAAFDRSAETAVYRAAPFRELASLPITVFNANFRTLSLIFEPEDLLN